MGKVLAGFEKVPPMRGLSREIVKSSEMTDELFIDLPYDGTNWPGKTENRKGDSLVGGIREFSED